MNATIPVSTPAKVQPSRLERVLGWLDLAIGVIVVFLCILAVISALRTSPPSRDNAVIGNLGIVVLLPFGLAALAAFDGMRTRAKGRWILQAVALLPVFFVGSVLLFS